MREDDRVRPFWSVFGQFNAGVQELFDLLAPVSPLPMFAEPRDDNRNSSPPSSNLVGQRELAIFLRLLHWLLNEFRTVGPRSSMKRNSQGIGRMMS